MGLEMRMAGVRSHQLQGPNSRQIEATKLQCAIAIIAACGLAMTLVGIAYNLDALYYSASSATLLSSVTLAICCNKNQKDSTKKPLPAPDHIDSTKDSSEEVINQSESTIPDEEMEPIPSSLLSINLTSNIVLNILKYLPAKDFGRLIQNRKSRDDFGRHFDALKKCWAAGIPLRSVDVFQAQDRLDKCIQTQQFVKRRNIPRQYHFKQKLEDIVFIEKTAYVVYQNQLQAWDLDFTQKTILIEQIVTESGPSQFTYELHYQEKVLYCVTREILADNTYNSVVNVYHVDLEVHTVRQFILHGENKITIFSKEKVFVYNNKNFFIWDIKKALNENSEIVDLNPETRNDYLLLPLENVNLAFFHKHRLWTYDGEKFQVWNENTLTCLLSFSIGSGIEDVKIYGNILYGRSANSCVVFDMDAGMVIVTAKFEININLGSFCILNDLLFIVCPSYFAVFNITNQENIHGVNYFRRNPNSNKSVLHTFDDKILRASTDGGIVLYDYSNQPRKLFHKHIDG